MSGAAIKMFYVCWQLLVDLSFYMLLGLAVSALIRAFLSPAVVARHLGGNGFGSVVKAALLGIPIPL